ncbi:MAG: PA14 domain-containing protein [Verrucomicrobia bacterium]|nr:PA14 domain-containing protein [Verrucomicrobiota bacterium]
MHGYCIPPTTGAYTFTIAADDAGELYLSASEDTSQAKMIAHATWSDNSKAQSAPVTLQQGKKYYIRALMVQSVGGAGLDVSWQGPGINKGVIAGTYLSPFLCAE